jgi:hypothetical protein
MTVDAPVGEVVEAATTEFVAQCHELYGSPPLGVLVKTGGDDTVYGVVAEVATRSLDPGRRPVKMGAGESDVEAIYSRNPQLGRLLSTEFRSVVVGHMADGRLMRYVAPLPPKIHDMVYPCGEEETREFSGSLHFLPLLLSAQAGSPDDVAAAFLRGASRSHADPRAFLVDAGRELASLLGGDLQRLNGILRRLAHD